MTDNEIELNAKIHNKLYNIYNSKHSEIYNEIEQKRLRAVISTLIKKKSNEIIALDFGAGTGNVSTKLLDENCKVIAADVSQKSLDLLKKITNFSPYLETKLINDKELPFEDNTFDVVCTYSVLHHVPDYLYLVKELIRVTKKDGLIYIDHEPNGNKWNPDKHLSAYYVQTKQTIMEHVVKLVKSKEIFTMDLYKTLLIKLFINKRFEREGYIHVWADDHVNWDEIKKVSQNSACNIIEENDYLLYRPKGGEAKYYYYKELTNDTKYIIIKK